jgi:nucleotide-binding universal stress UspA family protein
MSAPVTRVIAGASGPPGSLAALGCAERLARAHDAVLIPVFACEPPGGCLLGPAGNLRHEWNQLARQRMREALLAVWGEEQVDPWIRPRVEQGVPGWILVSVACQPGDLLVIGAARRGPHHRIARSQVSRYCAGRAACPVILIPPPDLARQARVRRLAWQLIHRTVAAEQILGDRDQPAQA